MIRPRVALLIALAVVSVLGLTLLLWPWRRSTVPSSTPHPAVSAAVSPARDEGPTKLYAHNLLLHKGPDFRIYIRWISGELVRTLASVNPSFDAPDSFILQIEKGVIRANIGDLSHYLNTSSPPGSPLTGISIQPAGEQLTIHGTVHKIVPLPVELTGALSSVPDGRVRFHVTKFGVMKIPLKGLLGDFHLQLSDLVNAPNVPGVQIAGNDIYFNTEKLLPPPHIRGRLTTLRVRPPDIEVIYGNAPDDEASLAQWHNFLRFRGGAVDFGKLTMHNVDLTMIDASKDPWFDLDLVNYQSQVVNGVTRMTADAGLEIFMPDVDEQAPKTASQSLSLEWLKNRNRSLPPDVKFK